MPMPTEAETQIIQQLVQIVKQLSELNRQIARLVPQSLPK